MKIAIVGCGALGGFYGSLLWRIGQETHFLLRSDFEIVRRGGMRVRSPLGDFCATPICAARPRDIGRCDMVLIGLKTTANDRLPDLLPPLLDASTVILTLQNGLGNEEVLETVAPAESIMGGLCFVCVNRVRPGVLHHLAHGRVVLGEHRRGPSDRTRRIASLIAATGVACEVSEDLDRAHWEKLVWNIPFNGLGVAAAAGYDAVIRGEPDPGEKFGRCLATDALLGDPKWEGLVVELMREIVEAGRAHGHGIAPDFADTMLDRTREMGAYRASTLIDFELGKPLEWENLFAEPLRRAAGRGVSTPRLAALTALLDRMDPGREARKARAGGDSEMEVRNPDPVPEDRVEP